MEGVVVGESVVCGSEGISCYQPSVAEEGQGFVVRIVQTLMDGVQSCEQLIVGADYREELTRIRAPVLQFHTNNLSSSITWSACPDSRNKIAKMLWLMDIYGG